MNEFVIFPHRTKFWTKILVFHVPNIPCLLAFFTWPQSYTFACIQNIAFPKLYILYYSIKIAIPRAKLIQFPYALATENLWTGTYHYIFPSIPYFASLFYLTNNVRVKKMVTIFKINYLNYTYLYSYEIIN